MPPLCHRLVNAFLYALVREYQAHRRATVAGVAPEFREASPLAFARERPSRLPEYQIDGRLARDLHEARLAGEVVPPPAGGGRDAYRWLREDRA